MIDWTLDGRGQIVAPVSTGFSLAVLRPPLLAIQIRCEASQTVDSRKDRHLQFRMSVQGAREFAAALLHAAQTVEDSPEVGRLH
jgi:hypothetical protein